jgi:hypothetical protein
MPNPLRTLACLGPLLAASMNLGGCASPATDPPAAANPPASPAGRPVPEAITPERLSEIVRSLPERRAAAGDAEDQRGLLETQGLLLARVRGLGYAPEEMPVPWSRRGAAEKPAWVNIFLELPGSVAPEEVLLIGAHFDAVPGSPGADDNGSGVAALLEVARVLKAGPPRRRTVRFALFNLEEVGLIGSTRYAVLLSERARAQPAPRGAPTAPLGGLVGMISLEMLGYYSTAPGSQRNPFAAIPNAPSRDVGDFLAVAGSSRDRAFLAAIHAGITRDRDQPGFPALLVDMFPSREVPIVPPDLLRSDHAPFLLRGVPSAMITDTANFRNPHYHKPTDTLRTLDLDRLAAATRALAATIGELADAPSLTPTPAPAPAPAPPTGPTPK